MTSSLWSGRHGSRATARTRLACLPNCGGPGQLYLGLASSSGRAVPLDRLDGGLRVGAELDFGDSVGGCQLCERSVHEALLIGAKSGQKSRVCWTWEDAIEPNLLI